MTKSMEGVIIFFSPLNDCLIFQGRQQFKWRSLYKDKLMKRWRKATENPEEYRIDRAELKELTTVFLRERLLPQE